MIHKLESIAETRLSELGALEARLRDVEASRRVALERLSSIRTSQGRGGPAVPVMLGFDIEPDRRTVDLTDPSWHAAIRLFEKFAALRQELSEAAPDVAMPVTWFPRADPQVEKANGSIDWALRRFEPEWTAAMAAGDEIGIHMHPWRWDDATGNWIQDHGDDDWVLTCLRASLDAFRNVFGHTPACYRGGDRFMSNRVARTLEAEGVTVDLTLERARGVERLVETERGSGSIPDGTGIPSRAFIASEADFRVPDEDRTHGLGMLPLTAGQTGTLVPWTDNLQFEEQLDILLDSTGQNNPPTHLAFVARADLALLPQWDELEKNLRSLARRAREGRIVFATASNTWQLARR